MPLSVKIERIMLVARVLSSRGRDPSLPFRVAQRLLRGRSDIFFWLFLKRQRLVWRTRLDCLYGRRLAHGLCVAHICDRAHGWWGRISRIRLSDVQIPFILRVSCALLSRSAERSMVLYGIVV